MSDTRSINPPMITSRAEGHGAKKTDTPRISGRRLMTALKNKMAIGALFLFALGQIACSGPPTVSVVRGASYQMPKPDPKTLTPSSILAFTAGEDVARGAGELVPMVSTEEYYGERWDIIVHAVDFKLRIKFDISNVGPGDFKGKVSGYIFNYKDGKTIDNYRIKASFAKGEWKVDPNGFGLRMGDYYITGEPGNFTVEGIAKDGENTINFKANVKGKAWRPGTGWVIIGDENKLYHKQSHISTMGPTDVTLDYSNGTVKSIQGSCYGGHQAFNIAQHDFYDRSIYARRISDDKRLLIEWRVIEASETYNKESIAFLVVAYDNEIIFASTDIEVIVGERWTDPGNYGYTVPSRLQLIARSGDDKAILTFNPNEPVKIKDPLAKLSTIERFAVKQIATPMEYSFKGLMRLDLTVDDDSATIEETAAYTVASFR